MQTYTTKHTDNAWVFYLDEDGSKHSVGKHCIVDGVEQGARTEQDALQILIDNELIK